MPFMKLPPPKSPPRFAVVPAVVAEDLLVVELLLTLSWDLAGVLLKDFFPPLKERGLASALSTGIVTTTVKANKLNKSKAFFHMTVKFLLLGLVCKGIRLFHTCDLAVGFTFSLVRKRLVLEFLINRF